MSDWPRIPPEWRGHTWPYRVRERDEHGNSVERIAASRFPPCTIGNPAETVDAFFDFRAYQAPAAPDESCQVHHRYLSKPEYEAGGCFTCTPWLSPNYKPATERMAS